MTAKTKQIVLSALSRYRGDDYLRARNAFSKFNEKEMQAQHGQSGQRRQQVLDDYRKHWDAVSSAIEEVEML